MAKLKCLCGEILSNVRDDNEVNGNLVPFWMLAAHSGDLDVIEHGIDTWECPSCGRIAIQIGEDGTMKWYRPEDGEPGHVMRDKGV